jgi:galactonate dehydratase
LAFASAWSEGADIIQPDPCHTRGISGLKRIAGMAEAYYIAVAPHNPNGSVATAVCLQLAACLPNFLFLEMPLDLGVPWRKDLLTDPLETFVDGCYQLPTQPGLGIELNMDAVSAHPCQLVDMCTFD